MKLTMTCYKANYLALRTQASSTLLEGFIRCRLLADLFWDVSLIYLMTYVPFIRCTK